MGDALDYSAKFVPRQDIMNYQHTEGVLHCVSNLNARILEDVYGPVLGHPEGDKLRTREYIALDPAEYQYVLCNPG